METTFRTIMDNILTRTGNSGSNSQNFPVAEMLLLINQEYLLLQRIVDEYNPKREITSSDNSANYYDQDLTAGNNIVTNTKDSNIRKVEYSLDSKNWTELKPTSVVSYEKLHGSLSNALVSKGPTHYISRLGNIQVLGIFDVPVKIRIWVTDNLVLPTEDTLDITPRLPDFAMVLLELSPTLHYKDNNNQFGTQQDRELYATTLAEFRKWARAAAPRSKLSYVSARRK